ncbi:MAG TPA: LCP family protein [Candidatus Acidoferrales bacterium]|nr:LCP family protein [Candidatus Acidoferrales bacterium]
MLDKQAPRWVGRVTLVLALILLGTGSALAGFAIFTHKNPIELIAQSFVPSPQQVFGKPNLLVLVEGIDYDYTDNDVEFSTSSRSDMIKAVNLDFDDKGVYAISVLRDMEATYPNGSVHKINQAQSDGGPAEAQKVIANFLGIPGFDRYVLLRIDATKDLVNAIGGVDVYVKTSDCLMDHTGCTGGRIDYDDSWGHLHIHLTEGMHHLNGDQAVSYGRFRHDWCSDPCRVMRQNDVIMAALNKLRGDKLNTLVHAGDIMRVVHRDIQTNFTDSELVTLASYFSGLSLHDVHFAQTPYTGDEELADGDDLIPDKPAIAKMVQTMLIAPPTPEPSPDAMALASIAAGSLRVDVENGSGVPGAAKTIADQLRKAGFTIGDVGNAPSDDNQKSEIQEHSSVTFAGAKVRAALPRAFANIAVVGVAPPSPVPSKSSDVTVIIGRDLANAVVAASAKPPEIR